MLTSSPRDGSRVTEGKELGWEKRSCPFLLCSYPAAALASGALSPSVSCWQRVSSQTKERPLLMVMSCHREFSFCWDHSCGALPPRSPATERLLSTESYLASAQRVCWIRNLMRVPRGLVSGQTSLPSFQAHQGASFLDSCPSPSSLQGEEQASVWQEQDTLGGFTQSPAVSSWLAEWSWLLVGIPWCEVPGQMGVTILLSQHSCPVGILPCFVLRQPMRESPDFLA